MDTQEARNVQGMSVYRQGAEDGLFVGLAMGVCAVCIILSTTMPALSWLAIAIFLSTPYMVWRFLRRGWTQGRVPSNFSAVWMHGICIFLFGAMIMALLMYVTLRFVTPGWIELQMKMAVTQLADNPRTQDQALVLTRIIEQGNLPSPIYTSVSAIWLVAFTGSIWSMIFAFVLTRSARFRNMRAASIVNQLRNE